MKYIVKDLTHVDLGIIAHGCNCSGGFASGVAGQIRKRWPIAYEKYKELIGNGNLNYIGAIQMVPIYENDTLFVANCFTQKFYGRNGRYAIPSAIESSLSQVFKYADQLDLPIYMPKIGCGLGGLGWEIEVLPIVERLDKTFARVDTYVCDKP